MFPSMVRYIYIPRFGKIIPRLRPRWQAPRAVRRGVSSRNLETRGPHFHNFLSTARAILYAAAARAAARKGRNGGMTMQTMYLALGIFLLTYVLMLTLQKYRPTIALSSALIFIVLGLCGVFDFRPLDALAAVDYNVL